MGKGRKKKKTPARAIPRVALREMLVLGGSLSKVFRRGGAFYAHFHAGRDVEVRDAGKLRTRVAPAGTLVCLRSTQLASLMSLPDHGAGHDVAIGVGTAQYLPTATKGRVRKFLPISVVARKTGKALADRELADLVREGKGGTR